VAVANTTLYDVAPLGTVAYYVRRTSSDVDDVNVVGRVNGTLANISDDSGVGTADGVVACAARGTPSAGQLLVVRTNGDAVVGDLWTLELSSGDPIVSAATHDIALGNVQGTGTSLTPNQVTCAWRSVAESGGEFRCYVFISGEEDEETNSFAIRRGYVDSSASHLDVANVIFAQGVASHAFDHDGQVYFWGVFAGSQGDPGDAIPLGFRSQLQNTYFLYRDDGTIAHAASAPAIAGGFAQTQGHLPGVQSLGGNRYAWAGIERRVIPIGEESVFSSGFVGFVVAEPVQTAYAARSPLEIVLELDSDDARRVVECGQTAYVAGGMVLQYDGEGLTEVGYHVLPWSFFGNVAGGSALEDEGTYTWQITWGWENAAGELDRSATGTTAKLFSDAGSGWSALLSVFMNRYTRKTDPRAELAVELWRTQKDGGVGAPFLLVTSKDPSAGSSAYIPNNPANATASFSDTVTDANLIVREAGPPAAVLDNLAPPPASIVAATTDRVFLAGIAGKPNQIAYSKLREPGRVVSFNGFLTVDVPEAGGPITALAVMHETLIAFCEHAVYALPGEGFDNLGGGGNYGPARLISTDVGAQSQETIGVTPQGILFHSSKGWYMLNRGFTVDYVGAPVDRFDGDTFVAVHVLETKHQIRCLSTSRCLVYDTIAEQWAEWGLASAVSAVIWNGTYHYATASDVLAEQDDFTGGANYSLDVETAWIKLSGLAGYAKLRWLHFLGEYRGAHDLRVRIGKDYDESAYIYDKAWTVSPTTVGGPERVRCGVSKPKGTAFRVRLTDQAVGEATVPTTEGLALTGLTFEVGLKRGGFKGPVAQKQ
jgi:hypothetical protein